MKKLKLFLSAAVLAVCSAGAFGEVLSLEDYVDLIKKNNNDLIAVQASIDAVKGKIIEIDRAYAYYFNLGGSYTDDKSGRPYSYPTLTTNEIKNISYDASINKQFAIGTKVTLGLNGSLGSYDLITGTKYDVTDVAPFIRLEQSLLKELGGGATKANVLKAKADAKSALYLLEYKKQSVLLNAKLAYWNLSYARSVVDFRTTSLDRTQKILDWNQKRYAKDLAEKSDLLQSQAAYKMRDLNLRLAKESEVQASRVFNGFLNSSSEKVLYDVEAFMKMGNNFEKGKVISKKGQRADLLAAFEDVESAKQAAVASKKSIGQDLVLTGQFSLNGVDEKYEVAKDYVLKGEKPAFTVGLKYTLPLDFSARSSIKSGYESAKTSAQKTAESAKIKESNDWLQLVDNWNNSKARLALLTEIQTIQHQRNAEEQNLLKKGRSTTYYVLQSEQDLDDSTLNVFQNILELVSIYEQAEAFYNTNEIE
ncbi:TolC family protein [Endomicrobium proavitum]|uniref:Outer membrane efflux protein n=1 Tax=Endomicrobium proavitum TaxID=1408281 RepID=A0A0G3WIG6_9BACT|nr:TolC family protein [Endomicrobium proavitum]AKL98093.1 exported protein of unknown function [Endomicrobium proavitum]